MKINLKYIPEKKSVLAENEKSQQVFITPSKEEESFGMAPMQLLLVSLASCSTPDIVEILKKQRQNLEDLQIKVEAERADEIPAVFKKIHLHYIFKGELDNQKLEKAINLSVNKYCSVAKMLSATVEITTSFEVL